MAVQGANDGTLNITVDSRQARQGLSEIESRVISMVNSTTSAMGRMYSSFQSAMSRMAAAAQSGATAASGHWSRFWGTTNIAAGMTAGLIQNRLGGAISSVSGGVRGLTTLFSSLGGPITRLVALAGGLLGLNKIFESISSNISRMVEVDRTFQGFIASMSIIRGSVAAANDEYKWLLNTSNALGVEVEANITQYHRLAASLKNVDRDGEMARQIFSGISSAAVVLHSRGRDITLMFEAVQQMASKGKLSLEELQRQLGNTLPGAVGMAARAMMSSSEYVQEGINNAADAERKLRKQIEEGTINVYEFLLLFSNQLKKEYGEGVQYAANQFQANFARMKNSIFEFYRAVGSSDAMKGLTEIIRELTGVFADAEGQGAAGFGQALGRAFRSIADAISSLESDDVLNFFDTVNVAFQSGIDILESFFEAFSHLGNPEMQTPLLDFVQFVATEMASMADSVSDAVNLIRGLFAGLMTSINGLLTGISYIPAKAAEAVNAVAPNLGGAQGRANRQMAIDFYNRSKGRTVSYAGDLVDANDKMKAPASYDRVNDRFDLVRQRMLGRKYGVTGELNWTVPGVPVKGFGDGSLLRLPETKAGLSANVASSYLNPLGDSDMASILETIKENSGAPNSGKKPKKAKKTDADRDMESSEKAFAREQTRLTKDLATATQEYDNVLSNKNRTEGRNEAQIRSLIATDDRYVRLSKEKKQELIDLAMRTDEMTRSVEHAMRVQEAMNETLRQSYDIESRSSELRSTGYESRYREATDAQNSFRKGGENELMSEIDQVRMLEAARKRDSDQRALDMDRYILQIRQSNDEIQFQNSLYGMSKLDAQILTEQRKIDLQVQMMSVGATQEQIRLYKEMAATLKGEVATALRETAQQQQDMFGGMKKGVQDWMDVNANWGEQMGQISGRAFDGMTDALVNFVETGKMSFGDLARSIAKDLVKLIVKYLLIMALQRMTGMGGGGMPYSAGDNPGMWSDGGMSGSIGLGYAKGGAFNLGSEMTMFALGGVVSGPSAFGMRGGNMGVMGEAGAEAIMPLARDRSGALGVRMVNDGAGGSSGSGTEVNLKIEVYQGEGSGVRVEKTEGAQGDVLKIFIGEVAADITKNGPVAKAITQTYGVRRSSRSYA